MPRGDANDCRCPGYCPKHSASEIQAKAPDGTIAINLVPMIEKLHKLESEYTTVRGEYTKLVRVVEELSRRLSSALKGTSFNFDATRLRISERVDYVNWSSEEECLTDLRRGPWEDEKERIVF